MSQPDLDTVIARRQSVRAEMAALDKMRRELESEDEDLVVAERVLSRLAELSSPDEFSPEVTAAAPADAQILAETESAPKGL
jgi:hypothetical protein